MASERLDVILSLITGNYKREAREAATATGQIASKAKDTGGSVTGMAEKFNAARGKMLLITAAAGALGAAFGAAISAASNLGESINATEKVFGDASDVIATFGQVSANAVGLSTREFNQLATVTGSMLTNLKFGQAEAARETIKLTQRASDMASVFNTDVGTALEAVNSALKGEANPIEQFGVKLNDATIRARAVELGLAKTTASVDDNAKAVATLNIIYEQTSKTQGDFVSTTDDLANSQRRSAAIFENAQARLGKALTPIAGNLTDRFAEGVERIAAAFGDEAAKKSLVFNEAIMSINKEMEAGTLGAEDLANALLHLAQNTDLTETDFETLAASVGLNEDQWESFSDDIIAQAQAMGIESQVIEEMVKAMSGLQDETEGTAAGIEDVGGAAQAAVSPLQAAAAAQRGLLSAMMEAANPAFAAAAASGRLAAAEENLAKLQEDRKTSVQDLAAAELDVAQATLEAQAAQDAFDASGVVAGVDAIADALGKSRDEVINLLNQLNVLDGTEVNTFINVNQRDRITRRNEEAGRTIIGGRQHGGPVTAGRTYRGGEGDKPEVLFIPGENGRVFSNSDTSAIIAAFRSGGGGGISVSVTVPPGIDDRGAYLVARAIKQQLADFDRGRGARVA